MPTNGAHQDGATKDFGVASTVKLYERPCDQPANEGDGADFVSCSNEVKIGDIGGWLQEDMKSHVRRDVVRSRATALFLSRKRPSLVGTFPGKTSQHSSPRRAPLLSYSIFVRMVLYASLARLPEARLRRWNRE